MKRHVKKGFTLIELLVVVAIISILMAILLPSLGKARAQAAQVACLARTKQLGQIMLMYAQEYNNTLIRARPTINGAASEWNVLIGNTMLVGNTTSSYNEKWHFCSQPGTDGNPNWLAYNGFLGHNYNGSAYDKWVDIKVTAIPQPMETFMITDAYFFYPQSTATTNKHTTIEQVRLDAFGLPTGTGHANSDKHMDGANFAFVDGHAEWLHKKKSAERAGTSSGQYAPFVKPYN